MNREEIEIDGIKFTLNIHIEKRKDVRGSLRKSNIHIRLPAFLGKKQRAQYVTDVLDDLKKQIRDNPELKPKPKEFRKYRDGEVLAVGRDEYFLDIKHTKTACSAARINGNVIKLFIAEGLGEEDEHRQTTNLISRCIAKRKQPELEKLVRELNEKHFHQEVNSVRLKNNKSNWGSCSKRGNINLSTRLLFAPDDVIEYVCIHELAHLIELNHSDRFWALVENAVPDFREKKQWLQNNCREFCF